MRKVLLGAAVAVVLGLSPVAAMALHDGGDSVTQPSQVAHERHARAVEARGEDVLAHHEGSDDRRSEDHHDIRLGDDPSTHDAGDDNSGLREAEPGDDHGGRNQAEPTDDHGGRHEAEAGADHGHGGRDG